jgi:hypothetical protein
MDPIWTGVKKPSCQSGQVDLDLSYLTRVVFFTRRSLNYLINHFEYCIVNHLINQISTHFFS